MSDVLAAARREHCEVAGDRMRAEITVYLEREPQNRQDHNAIVVRCDRGRELGHVARELASEYAPVFDQIAGLDLVQCAACVYGRDIRGEGWRAGIWLALPTPKAMRARRAREPASPS